MRRLRLNAPFGAQCFPTRSWNVANTIFLSQCTFWCSVLSDASGRLPRRLRRHCLNAPFGAQCFPTQNRCAGEVHAGPVSMHLLVLSAFRQEDGPRAILCTVRLNAPFGAQCFPTGDSGGVIHMQDSSLNAPFGAQCFPTGHDRTHVHEARSQCTFWCSVLSDRANQFVRPGPRRVSMHLLVLSAFRQEVQELTGVELYESQCTFWCSVLSDPRRFSRRASRSGLNAPFGAQCFPTIEDHPDEFASLKSQCTFWCSVLSDTSSGTTCPVAFPGLNAPFGAQCFPTIEDHPDEFASLKSQCTFWCSVLSDLGSVSLRRRYDSVSMHLLVLSAFRRDRRLRERYVTDVSMHLLVLSAFRQVLRMQASEFSSCLNAPFGAQCFPT